MKRLMLAQSESNLLVYLWLYSFPTLLKMRVHSLANIRWHVCYSLRDPVFHIGFKIWKVTGLWQILARSLLRRLINLIFIQSINDKMAVIQIFHLHHCHWLLSLLHGKQNHAFLAFVCELQCYYCISTSQGSGFFLAAYFNFTRIRFLFSSEVVTFLTAYPWYFKLSITERIKNILKWNDVKYFGHIMG